MLTYERLEEIKRRTSLRDRIKFSIIFWGITGPSMFFFIPAAIFAYLNPFWFRRGFQEWLGDQFDVVGRWRWKFLKPIIDKYLLLDVIKGESL